MAADEGLSAAAIHAAARREPRPPSVPTIPLVGASSVDQIRESLDAVDLTLTADQRARLDEAR
jgi:aryl-alcohol dehydrogenase-like predicted oxidoreductase